MHKHVAQRFLIPPFVFVALVGLAVLLADPKPSWWDVQQVEALEQSAPLVPVAIAFLTASTAIFAFGFVIASIAVSFTRALAFVLGKPRGFSVDWSDEARGILEKMYHFKDFNLEAEQCEQCFLGEVASPHVRGWMRGRWEYYIININCVCACIMAIVVIFLLRISMRWDWCVVVALLGFAFLFNGIHAWREVRDMDNFLVRNLEKMRELRLHMKPSHSREHVEDAAA